MNTHAVTYMNSTTEIGLWLLIPLDRRAWRGLEGIVQWINTLLIPGQTNENNSA